MTTTRPTSAHVRRTGIGDTQATTENIAGNTPIVENVTTLLQCCRNAKTRVIAKMDESKPAPVNKPGAFYLLPLIAKMDASPQKVLLIPLATIKEVIAKEDSIALGNSVG